MRIVYLAAENSVLMYNWAIELQKRGHQIVFISEKPHSNPPKVPFQLIKLRFKNSFFKFWINKKKIEDILKIFKADIVHAFYSTNYGLLATRQRVCPTVVTVGGSDLLVEPQRSKFFKWINFYVFSNARFINPLSKHLKTILNDTYGIGGKAEVFPAGIDPSIFYAPTRIVEQPVQIISTRNFKPVYNQKLFMQTIPNIIKNYKSVNFILFGDGPERRIYQEQLKQYQQITWLGWKPRDLIAAELRNSHIYVSTSLSDGTSSSLLEAMVSGVFPIVTDIIANRDWIDDGVNGYLVPVDDPDFLTKRIVEAIQDHALRNKAQKINIELVHEKANFHEIVTKLEDIYTNIVK